MGPLDVGTVSAAEAVVSDGTESDGRQLSSVARGHGATGNTTPCHDIAVTGPLGHAYPYFT